MHLIASSFGDLVLVICLLVLLFKPCVQQIQKVHKKKKYTHHCAMTPDAQEYPSLPCTIPDAVNQLYRTCVASGLTRAVRAAAEAGACKAYETASKSSQVNGARDPVYLASTELAEAANEFARRLEKTVGAADAAMLEALHGTALAAASATQRFAGARREFAVDAFEQARRGFLLDNDAAALAGFHGEACRPPMDASRTPVDASRTPVDASRTPVDASRTPVEASRTPVDASRTPVDASRTAFEWVRATCAHAAQSAQRLAHSAQPAQAAHPSQIAQRARPAYPHSRSQSFAAVALAKTSAPQSECVCVPAGKWCVATAVLVAASVAIGTALACASVVGWTL